MNFERIRNLSQKPRLYEKGTAEMWTDPYISKQLLELHLDPEHDTASRSRLKIAGIVNWILEQTGNPRLKILDLGCGPGLYAEHLAQKGHSVTGVDFSENSLQYAIRQAKEKNLDIEYRKLNYLDLDVESRYDLVILIYLDFCVLLPEERDKVLENICRALKKEGLFICDVINERGIGKFKCSRNWEVQESGFWKETPYIALTDGYHYPEAKTFANQHIVIGEDGTVERYIFWNHYFEKDELAHLLESKGFNDIKCYENIIAECSESGKEEGVTFYVAKK